MKEVKCPYDLNQFLLGEPLFTNTFLDNECEEKKFYGDCFHCFETSIRKRDKQLINSVLDEIRAEIEQAADKQFQITMGVADLNARYTHIQMENAYRHSLNIIDKYKASGAESEE